MPVRGVRFCKVYDIARRERGVNVFGRNADNVPRDLSHAGAWMSTCDCTLWPQVKTSLATTVHEKMCRALGVSVHTPVDCQKIKLLASEMTSLNKEEKFCSVQDDKAQSRHCMLEEISHSSKYSVLPMLMITSFDFSLRGLNSSVLFKSFFRKSQFGWFSNCWISLFTISFRFESSFWTIEWGIPWIL